MTKSRKRAASGGDARPIVTYAHVPLDTVDEKREPHGLVPDVDILDAVEVPLVAQGESIPRARTAAPDLRADPRADGFEPMDEIAAGAFEPERRSWRGRALVLLALVVVAGGAGAVAASLGVFAPAVPPVAPVASTDPATELIAIHKQIDELGEASSPEAQAKLATLTKRLAELEQSGSIAPDTTGEADAPKAVRQISLSPGASGEAGSPPVIAQPPVPRPRPEEKLASRPAAEAPIADEPPAAAPVAVAPVEPAAPRAKAAAKAAPAVPAGDDGFIASVEKALADSQSKPELPRPVAPAMSGPAAGGPAGPSPLPSPAAIAAPPSGMQSLPTADDSVDPYALPAPLAKAEPVEPQPKLPPGVKLPPADIPNVPPPDQQY